MCDKAVSLGNGIRAYESEVDYLKKLVKACEEDRSKGYPCELLTEQIMKKEKDIEIFREAQKKYVALCNLYQQIDKELNK
jgi:hypothetical protein